MVDSISKEVCFIELLLKAGVGCPCRSVSPPINAFLDDLHIQSMKPRLHNSLPAIKGAMLGFPICAPKTKVDQTLGILVSVSRPMIRTTSPLAKATRSHKTSTRSNREDNCIERTLQVRHHTVLCGAGMRLRGKSKEGQL
jgi:hypothetical protein